ncbi:MAG TPA: CRISPR-associated endonuclease Cas6 [Prolixibacteraceae bacterium]|nr:CRISPR-associated endonuclease Cas6 [Prolixibacteraceae bacterium]
MKIVQTIISFPEIRLQTRDGHKLRGYFGQLFQEHSPLLHNHFEDGTLLYRYPLVQYKVVNHIPLLVGFLDGADLLVQLFLKMKELKLDDQTYPVFGKNIRQFQFDLSPTGELVRYRFETLWMALNQNNYTLYHKLSDEEKKVFLNKNLQNNILSFYKGLNYFTPERIMANAKVEEKVTQFKNQSMLAFSGEFVSNAVLPDYAGIGKAVSRGFGTLRKI